MTLTFLFSFEGSAFKNTICLVLYEQQSKCFSIIMCLHIFKMPCFTQIHLHRQTKLFFIVFSKLVSRICRCFAVESVLSNVFGHIASTGLTCIKMLVLLLFLNRSEHDKFLQNAENSKKEIRFTFEIFDEMRIVAVTC